MPCEMSGPNTHRDHGVEISACTWTFCTVSNRHKTKFDHSRRCDSGDISDLRELKEGRRR